MARGTPGPRRRAGSPAAPRGPHPRASTGELSYRVQVVVPQVEIHAIPWRGTLAPQRGRAEAHAVDVVRLLAEAHRAHVGESEDAVVPIDHALATAGVARQPRVAGRVRVARDDAIAGPELRRHVVVDPGGEAVLQRLRHPARPPHPTLPRPGFRLA